MKPYDHVKTSGGLIDRANADGRQLFRVGLGGGLGGLLGLALGAGTGLVSESFLADPKKTQYLRKMLQGAGIGTLAGAGLGAGFGATSAAKNLHYGLEEGVAEFIAKVLSSVKFETTTPLGTMTSQAKPNQSTEDRPNK